MLINLSFILKRCVSRGEPEDDTRYVSDSDRPVALLLEKAIAHPQRAIDTSHKRLKWVARMSTQILLDHAEVKNIHQDGCHHTTPAYTFKKFALVHNCTLFKLLLRSFDISDHISFVHFGTLFGIDLNEFATQCCRNSNKFAPGCLQVAECVALLIVFADEWLNRRSTFAVAIELPEYLTLDRCNNGIGLGVLESRQLFG